MVEEREKLAVYLLEGLEEGVMALFLLVILLGHWEEEGEGVRFDSMEVISLLQEVGEEEGQYVVARLH